MINRLEQTYMESQNTLEQATSFVRRNVIPARVGRKCVDGRYQLATEDSGLIARPGGDAGYVEVLLALNKKFNLGLGPEQCFDKVYEAVTANDGTFYMHTDHHTLEADTEPLSDKIGCGHLAKATNPELASGYQVDPAEVKAVIKYAKKGLQEGKKIKIVDLPGDHKEEWVFVVEGQDKTINPSDSQQMGFVYDLTRDQQFIENELFPKLNLEKVTVEDFLAISDIQLKATLKNLASGLPIIKVNVDQANPLVALAGRVD